ncbi:hypothetical protein KQX54_011047 [Cotesia glomerata]|uniref:Uncharacterized protein n=1 Tax=Cotesia glomerata TaxID=32391 RepID=A0AAV7J8E5_COTGL|nr:hypothetical protein KQX54_011047 [Cotesia glomerata]
MVIHIVNRDPDIEHGEYEIANRQRIGHHACEDNSRLGGTVFAAATGCRLSQNNQCPLFYRKRLIALPITDNATINDLGWCEGPEEKYRE